MERAQRVAPVWALWILWTPIIISAQEISFDEDELFSEPGSTVELEEQPVREITEALREESISFSGGISAATGMDLTRKAVDGSENLAQSPYSATVEWDLLLDIRTGGDTKAFADLLVLSTPIRDGAAGSDGTGDGSDADAPSVVSTSAESFELDLREAFVDLNIARRVFFKFGKQTLKWGPAYFWNPTDLVSEDRRELTDLDGRREGTFGLKAHIPFGTRFNLFGFINADGAEEVGEIALAGRAQLLIAQRVEAGLSGWYRERSLPVYGLDLRTRLREIDLWGEMSLSYGDNRPRLEVGEEDVMGTPTPIFDERRVREEWVSRASVGIGRSFDIGDVNDRLRLIGEFFYNGGGYTEDLFEDEATRLAFLGGDFYEPGFYGRYYVGLFSGYRRFFHPDMTLVFNGVGNLTDRSFALSAGIDYEIVANASVGLRVDGYLGEENREYTAAGSVARVTATVNLSY